jgi:hypothetical protein
LTILFSLQLEKEKQLIKMLKEVLNTPYFYFSSYDLTHTLQRLTDVDEGFYKMSQVMRADERFLWNHHLLEEFTEEEIRHFCVPVMMGCKSFQFCFVLSHS